MPEDNFYGVDRIGDAVKGAKDKAENITEAIRPRENANFMPDVIVESIKLSAGNQNVTEEFSEPFLASDLTPDFIRDILTNMSELIPEIAMELNVPQVKYNMTVVATTPIAARMKARAFVRVKNPFEPMVVDVEVTGRDKGMEERLARNAYKVSASTGKR